MKQFECQTNFIFKMHLYIIEKLYKYMHVKYAIYFSFDIDWTICSTAKFN